MQDFSEMSDSCEQNDVTSHKKENLARNKADAKEREKLRNSASALIH